MPILIVVQILVARQPIFDRHERLYGYDLMLRGTGADSSAADSPPEQLVADTFLGIGIEQVAAGRRAFVTVGRDMLISGAGGLPTPQANMMLNDLAQSTPTAPDGMVPGGVYPQRFGIPEGLPGEPVAVKQGWMCCIGADWMHLSTGVIGTDRRYVMAISSMEATDAADARATITQAVKTMFPGGRL